MTKDKWFNLLELWNKDYPWVGHGANYGITDTLWGFHWDGSGTKNPVSKYLYGWIFSFGAMIHDETLGYDHPTTKLYRYVANNFLFDKSRQSPEYWDLWKYHRSKIPKLLHTLEVSGGIMFKPCDTYPKAKACLEMLISKEFQVMLSMLDQQGHETIKEIVK